MLGVFIFLIIIILKADARGPDNDPLEVTFKITQKAVEDGGQFICDHNIADIQKNIYTVREGQNITIIAKHFSYVKNFFCKDYNDFYVVPQKRGFKNVATFKVETGTPTIWNCTVLAHRNVEEFLPTVKYDGHTYTAAYCFMKIHVRRTNSPQTILVNNMVLQAVRTDLSEKDVDFTAEYRYADGDVVNVTCINFSEPAPLTMEYAMAGTMSDNSIMKELSSDRAIGFRVKLHSGHNNSYMICTRTKSRDYTKVMMRFVMQTEFRNTVSVKINGMIVRPKLVNVPNNLYIIDYKYLSNQPIDVVCEVQRADIELVVVDTFDFFGKVSSYVRTELIPGKKVAMSFYLNPTDDKTLPCDSDHMSGVSVEQDRIHFTEGYFLPDQYPLHMELPSNGTVMELYNDDKLNVIFYEFEDGETLQLKCGPVPFNPRPGPVLYLQMKDDKCIYMGCAISKTLHVSNKDENTEIACYLKEPIDEVLRTNDMVVREIRVILRARVLTATSTTTTTTISPVTALTTNTADVPASSETSSNSNTWIYCLTAAGVGVIIILAILYLTVKKPFCCIVCRSSSQELPSIGTPTPNPDTVYYENLLSVFQPINAREAAEMENHYEEIQ